MLRVDFNGYGTTAEFADAVTFQSSGANRNLKIKNHSYGIAGSTYDETNSEETNLVTSAAAGTIHCWAAGNSRGQLDQDCNKTDLQNNPNALTIAALGSDGTFAYYSSFGACVIATAPSNDTAAGFGIMTTDRTGTGAGYNGSENHVDREYTTRFGGTSSASPLAAGVMAVVKHANPNLNARFAKHLIVRTSDIVDPTDGTESGGGDGSSGSAWKTNAAGNEFNQNYGFGVLDADELTLEARRWSGVTALVTEQEPLTTVNLAIPDDDPTGISRTFSLASTTPLEEIEVTLSVTHPYRGDLEAFLQSPSGTLGRLMFESASDATPNLNWTFTSNQFWGENPAGTWTLIVRDSAALDLGTWNNFSINARMGRLLPRIDSLSPSSRPAGSGAFTLTVNGSSFAANSLVQWKGSTRTTTFVNSNQVTAEINAADVADAGTATVSVLTGTVQSNTVEFTITHSITVSATSVTAGNSVTATWNAPLGSSSTDWIGVFAVGASDREYQSWIYTGGSLSGTWTVPTSLTPTTFELRYLLNNGFTSVVTSQIVTTTAPTYTLTASPSAVSQGGNVTVNWTAPAGRSPHDWIGMFLVTGSNREYISWIYTGAEVSGTHVFTAPNSPGTIQFRYLLNDGYALVTATSGNVTVE